MAAPYGDSLPPSEHSRGRPGFQRQISEASHVWPVTKDKFNQINKKRLAKKHRRQKDVRKSAYLNRVIHYLGEKKAGLESNAQKVADFVEQFVDGVMGEVGMNDQRFKGKLIRCGSYYEGVKVKEPNEFDYIFELDPKSVDHHSLEMNNVRPDTFKPHKQDTVRPKSYYKLAFKSKVPHSWWCGDCEGCQQTSGVCTKMVLNPRRIQDDFLACVKVVVEIILRREHLDDTWRESAVTSNGPAVTICARLDPVAVREWMNKRGMKRLNKMGSSYEGFMMKIDISLAIPVQRTRVDQTWPLQAHSSAELNPEALDSDVTKCHLVPSGDFWRVSFSHLETQEMRNRTSKDAEKKDIYQALKYLRDDLALTGDHEAGLLSTYPLKVTFMKETQAHPQPADWGFWNMSQRTIDILEKVEEEGSRGTMSSYFLKDDSVLMESDRSYLESRRLKEYLLKCESIYHLHGLFHTGSVLITAVCMLAILASSCVYMGKVNIDVADMSCPLIDRSQTQFLGSYLFVILPSATVAILASFLGIMWVVIPRCLLPTTNVIYYMFTGIIWVHLSFLVVAFIILCFGIRLTVGYHGLFGCFNDAAILEGLTISCIVFSSLVLLAILLHVIFFMVVTRCGVRKYMLEWVFFDELYRENLCCCAKKKKEPSEETGSAKCVMRAPSGEPQCEVLPGLEHYVDETRDGSSNCSIDNPAYGQFHNPALSRA